VTKT